jgi:hypothetical protein
VGHRRTAAHPFPYVARACCLAALTCWLAEEGRFMESCNCAACRFEGRTDPELSPAVPGT